MLTPNRLSVFIISFVLLFVFSNPTSADDTDTIKYIREFSSGFEVAYFDYSEPGMEETGYLPGFQSGYEYGIKRSYLTEVTGDILIGGLDYDGQTLETDPSPVQTETDDVVANIGFHLGPHRERNNAFYTPYSGLAYRYWSNEIKDSGNVAGFERTTQYIYLPIGMKYEPTSSGLWQWKGQLEYRYLIEGTVQSNLSDALSTFPDVENTQDAGHGIEAELNLRRKTEYGQNIDFDLFVRFWDINASDAVSTGQDIDGDGDDDSVFEPANETLVSGLRLNIRF